MRGQAFLRMYYMKNDWIYDIETYPNVFTVAFEHAFAPFKVSFEISEFMNQSYELIDWLHHIKNGNGRMVGFNNVSFDYPVIHMLLRMGYGNPRVLYQKAMAIIESQYGGDKFMHYVKPSDYVIEQIDLFKIHHFDNVSRATGLKALEFNMRSRSIQDLPFPVGTELTREQIDTLKQYNAHDVSETKKFYHLSRDMIAFREELTTKYQRNFMNHNDTKIGKDYFVMELEKAGVECYKFGSSGRTPNQTLRPVIHLKDAILPWINLQQPEFVRVSNWLKAQSITVTKGSLTDVTATINGFTFVFGLGGIHGSIESCHVQSDDEWVIVDLDVASYYPNLAITNGFYPEHLGAEFCKIYEILFEQRTGFKKGTAENAMLKLALNGVYGDSNSAFSVFFDSLFTMKITLNGQLLLCVLAEGLMTIDGLQIVQINTDGITVKVKRSLKRDVDTVAALWQQRTKLVLEEAIYTDMYIRDVNNYIAVYEGGKVKRKGAYEYKVEWHQNAGGLVIPKCAERTILDNTRIDELVLNHDDNMDFMLRTKVPKSSKLMLVQPDGTEVQIQNTSRYYIAKGGGHLVKVMPPLAKKPGVWRRFNIESGWGVCVCNDLDNYEELPIDYRYYINEVEKLCLVLA